MTGTPSSSRDLLRRIPKAELHCHLDGSVRPQTLLDLAAEYGKPMPRADATSLAAYMLARDSHNLEEYLARFSVTLSVMQTASALERIAYELATDAAADGVRYIEVRYAPILNVREGLSLGAAVEAPLRGLARAEHDTGIVGRLIICGLRTMPPSVSMELAELAVAYAKRGVVAFDLAGGEAGHSAAAHRQAFAHAHAHHLPCTCHAGEGDGPSSVREALQACCADRVGHGTRIIEDAVLLDDVIRRQVPIEVCLTSNVQTHAAASYDAHPLREFYDRGVNVVLNTDNRLMSGTTLTDEYEHAAAHLRFTFDELSRVALNGFQSAFLPDDQRNALVAAAQRELATLRRAIA
jgi:adenosine deaminase